MVFMEGSPHAPPVPSRVPCPCYRSGPRGPQVKQTALDLGIHEVTLHNWLRQDDIDHGRRPGRSSQESAELRAARGRVRQLEQEIAILRRAATWLDEEGGVAPKGRTR